MNTLQGLVRIVLIVALAYIVVKLLRGGLTSLEAFLIRSTGHGEPEFGAAAKRIRTLLGVLWTMISPSSPSLIP